MWLELTVSDVSVLLPGDVERDPARHRDLLPHVVGDGEEGVPAVERQGLGQVMNPASQVDGGRVLSTGRVVVVPDSPDPLHSVAQGSPGLGLTPWTARYILIPRLFNSQNGEFERLVNTNI